MDVPSTDAGPPPSGPTADPDRTGGGEGGGGEGAGDDADAFPDAIPDDAVLGHEELPADLFDRPPLPAADRPRRDASRREGPRRSPPPPGRADGAATSDGGDLGKALLGADADDTTRTAVQDTVQAILELFPGQVVAVTPRGEPDDDESTGTGAGGADAPTAGPADGALGADDDEAPLR